MGRGAVTRPYYKAWRPDVGETEDAAAEWDAIDTRRAAEAYAREAHHRDPARDFPMVVRVRDPKGIRWDVTVERIAVPEFHAETPQRAP